MSAQVPAQPDHDNDPDTGAGPRRPVWLLAQWAAVTVFMTWIAPFAAVATLVAVGSLIGITIADLHGSAVGVATLASEDWTTFGAIWHEFAWCCSAAVVAWRVWSAGPVSRKREVLAARFDSAAASAFSPVARRLDSLNWSPRKQAIAVVVAFLFAMLLLVPFELAHEARIHEAQALRRDAPVGAPVMPSIEPSAAIVLRDGGIRSGHAAVEQHGDDTYVVSFRHAGKHE